MQSTLAQSIDRRLPVESIMWVAGGVGALALAIASARDLAGLAGWVGRGDLTILRLDGERNILAWCQTFLLMLIGVSMLWAAGDSRRSAPRVVSLGWALLGIGFLYLAIDESNGDLHERFGEWLAWVPDPLHFFHFRWLLVGFPLAAIVAVLFLPMLMRLPRGTAVQLTVAGAVYVLGVLGFEAIGSVIDATMGRPLVYVLATIGEEGCELLGSLLALRCVLVYLNRLRVGTAP